MSTFNQEGQTVGVQVNVEKDSSQNISLTSEEVDLIVDGLYCSILEDRGDDDSPVPRIHELLNKLANHFPQTVGDSILSQLRK